MGQGKRRSCRHYYVPHYLRNHGICGVQLYRASPSISVYDWFSFFFLSYANAKCKCFSL